jgi:hypothetical protein
MSSRNTKSPVATTANSIDGGAASSGRVTAKVRFFLNGLKIDGGKLHKAHLSLIERWTKANGEEVDTHVALYAPGCSHFAPEVRALLPVENNTELASDYFETDRIRIPLGHPLFNPALAAVIHAVERDIRRCTKLGKLEDAATYQRKWDDLQGVASGAARPWETERGSTTGEVSCVPERTEFSPHDARRSDSVAGFAKRPHNSSDTKCHDGMYVCPEFMWRE